MTAGELLEGYLGSAQSRKPATAASHRHVVSTLLNDPLCRCGATSPIVPVQGLVHRPQGYYRPLLCGQGDRLL
jgi:hypothetical protein